MERKAWALQKENKSIYEKSQQHNQHITEMKFEGVSRVIQIK